MTLNDNIDPFATQKIFQGFRSNFFFNRPADRGGRESITLNGFIDNSSVQCGNIAFFHVALR